MICSAYKIKQIRTILAFSQKLNIYIKINYKRHENAKTWDRYMYTYTYFQYKFVPTFYVLLSFAETKNQLLVIFSIFMLRGQNFQFNFS